MGTVFTTSSNNAIDASPFGAPGKLNGLWMIKTFEDVFKFISAPAPDPLHHVFLPSFNELQISPQPMSQWNINNTHFYAMGGEGDPDAYRFFLDGYGDQRSRILEPSVFDDGYTFQLLSSCIRVSRLLTHFVHLGGVLPHTAAPSRDSGFYSTCAVAGEACCTVTAEQQFSYVWSLEGVEAAASLGTLLTNSPAEAEAQLALGSFFERCNPWGGPAGLFCANSSLPWHPWDNANVLRGPFALYQNNTAQRDLPGVAPLFRCYNATLGQHFIDASQDCMGGGGTVEFILGYLGTKRDSLFPRTLKRCLSDALGYFHVLDGNCSALGGSKDIFLGFVM